MELNLDMVDGFFFEDAKKAIAKGDIEGALCYMGSHKYLTFLSDNIFTLQKMGVYEQVLVTAFTGVKINSSDFPEDWIRTLFKIADPKKMRALYPTPDNIPEKIYRGVSGVGKARRLRGVSWTGNFEKAEWFARRFGHLKNPFVLSVNTKDVEIIAYYNGRNEDEYMALVPYDLKPMVEKKLKPKSCYLEYSPQPMHKRTTFEMAV